MMAFFMVMWIMGLSDSSKAQVSGYFNDPAGFMKNMPRSKSIINAFQGPPPKSRRTRDMDIANVKQMEDTKDLKQLKSQISQALNGEGGDGNGKKLTVDPFGDLEKQVEVTLTREGLRIELVENAGAVFFETGSASIRPKAHELIMRMGLVIANSGRHVFVEGHTDARRYQGNGYDNWDLSGDRANALRRVLMESGVTQQQIQKVTGYADRKLKVPSDPLHYSNRRVSILLPYESVEGKVITPKEQAHLEAKASILSAFQIRPIKPSKRQVAAATQRAEDAEDRVNAKTSEMKKTPEIRALRNLIPDELKTPGEQQSGNIGDDTSQPKQDERRSLFPWRPIRSAP